MRFAATAAAAGLAGVAAAQGGYAQMPANGTTVAPVYVTEVVTAFTTYCPEATQITHGGQTYTVSSVSARCRHVAPESEANMHQRQQL